MQKQEGIIRLPQRLNCRVKIALITKQTKSKGNFGSNQTHFLEMNWINIRVEIHPANFD
ncbi:MAG: hypothetical protein K9H61_09825 [Bacteroidia bacterium]|nr:hypothetical protein [Bacteroidia bacterium]MCF8427879.1 hypothetical protein [Bacteroidia bacterium]MCF8447280.1 hypothetical protein [Bacteroidia bacterium]